MLNFPLANELIIIAHNIKVGFSVSTECFCSLFGGARNYRYHVAAAPPEYGSIARASRPPKRLASFVVLNISGPILLLLPIDGNGS